MRANGRTRLVLSGLFAFSLVLFAAGFALGSDALRLLALCGALFFGIGTAPLQLSERASLDLRLCVAALIGLSLPVVVASVMVLAPVWHPLLAAVLAGAVAVGVHAVACRRVLSGLSGPSGPRILGPVRPRVRELLDASAVCSLGGTAAWAAGVAVTGHVAAPGVLGFLPRAPVYWYLGLGLLVAGIMLARGRGELRPAFGVVSLLAALTLTPAVVYGMPRQPAGAKHVDLVLAILQTHHISGDAGIYKAYSGLFSAVAWLCDVSGMRDVMAISTYWPFFIDLLVVVCLRFLFGQLTRSRYRVWVAVMLAILVNSIGTDYFSPQSVGFALGLGVFGLVLVRPSAGLSERGRIAILLLSGCALAVTHELSPYIVGGVLVILVIFRVARPWYLPAVVLGPALAWALMNLEYVSEFFSLADLGSLANFEPPQQSPYPATPGLQRLPIVAEGSDALTLGLVVLAVIACAGFARRIRSRYAWAFMLSNGVGLALIAANAYGNEGIFRAALFSIPWLAAVGTQALPAARSRWPSTCYGVVAAGLVGAYLISMFGLDNFNVIRPADYQALAAYNAAAAPDSYLLNLSRTGDMLPHALYPPLEGSHSIGWGMLITQAEAEIMRPTPRDADAIAGQYYQYARGNGGETAELYAIWSPAAADYALDYGFETLAQSRGWRAAFIASPDWEVVYGSDGTYLFRVRPGLFAPAKPRRARTGRNNANTGASS